MTSKNKRLDFGCYFLVKIKAHTAILRRFTHICPNFHRFSINQKFWGWSCTPCTPASYTSTPVPREGQENTTTQALKSPRNVANTFCNAVGLHLLPKD